MKQIMPAALLSTVLLSLILMSAQTSAQSASEHWAPVAPPLMARQEIYADVYDGKIYSAGGILPDNTEFTDHFEVYHPELDRWTKLAPLPEPRHHITMSSQGDRIYGIGGFFGGFPDWRAQSSVYVYDPTADSWIKGVDLPTPRAEHVAAVVDGKIYVIGGRVRETEDAHHFTTHIDSTLNEVFDPQAGRWSTIAEAPTARNSAAAAVIDGNIYVVGGRQNLKQPDGSMKIVNFANLEVYDPSTNTWAVRAPMPQGQGGLAAAAVGGKLYVFGGEQWTPEKKVFGEAWVYDPEADRWRALPAMPTPRHGLTAAAVGSRIFVFGGAIKTGSGAVAVNEVLVLAPSN